MTAKVKAKRHPGYSRIRARLIVRGLSLKAWATERGYSYTTVVSAARGERRGPLSKRILSELTAEA